MYVFADPPKRWKCGIVHLPEYSLESDKNLRYKDFFQAVTILMRIQKAAVEFQLDCRKSPPLTSTIQSFMCKRDEINVTVINYSYSCLFIIN